MSITPLLERPPVEPQHITESRHELTHWPAAPGQPGKLEIIFDKNRPLELDEYLILHAMRRVEGMDAYFDHMGIRTAQQAKGGRDKLLEIQYPHPEDAIPRWQKLGLPEERFRVYDGGEAPAEELVAALRDTGSLLLATKDISMPHDVLVHGASAWALIACPAVVNPVRKRAALALSSTYPLDVLGYARSFDLAVSSIQVGSVVMKALARQKPDEPSHQLWYEAAFNLNLLNFLNHVPGATPDEIHIDPNAMRAHATGLLATARASQAT